MMISEHGVSLNEGMLLCCLSTHGTLSSSDIADSIGLTYSNTSKVIGSVEKKGLIKRTLDENDKRSMLFALTAEGAERLKQIKNRPAPMPSIIENALKT